MHRGVTGCSIGSPEGRTGVPGDHGADAVSLYEKLDQIILPLYQNRRDDYLDLMRHAVTLNGSFFNTHRMLQQYLVKAYF